jgi:prepilin-type N-terminal cleavage/methylation domain-containing protein
VVIVPGALIFPEAKKIMKNISRISQHKHEKARTRDKSASARKGFTLVEILVALAIIGIMALIFYPNIINTLESRKIEGSAREVLTTLQRAKFQAVKTKLNHRVRFEAVGEGWVYYIEKEDNPTEWNTIRGFLRRSIPSEFQVNVDFPNDLVEFSPLGFVANYSSTQNTITLQSLKLATYGKPDERVIRTLVGGSIQYIIAEGEKK